MPWDDEPPPPGWSKNLSLGSWFRTPCRSGKFRKGPRADKRLRKCGTSPCWAKIDRRGDSGDFCSASRDTISSASLTRENNESRDDKSLSPARADWCNAEAAFVSPQRTMHFCGLATFFIVAQTQNRSRKPRNNRGNRVNASYSSPHQPI